MKLTYAIALLVPLAACAQAPVPAPAVQPATTSSSSSSSPATAHGTWQFVVSGDSRNCGDVVMPGIAEAARKQGAKFYWHLGDWRAIYSFDEDMAQSAVMAGNPLQVHSYLVSAFKDAIDNQLKAFDDRGVPVLAGIGNHETAWPMTRAAYVKAFKAYLDRPEIRDQRLKDDPNDTTVRTYFHVIKGGIDFIYLDNASCDMFDDAQMTWFRRILDHDASDPAVRTVVLGVHAALPDSRSCGHSMGNYPIQQTSGREVYKLMLGMRDLHKKHVYVLASHSHFVMDNVYDTDYWRKNGGVLDGWIVGTSGAVRYRLPETAIPGPNTRTDVYGYLLATVNADSTINFEFHELTSKDIPADVLKKYSKNFVDNFCFAANRNMAVQTGFCPPMLPCSDGE